jgi:excisionase family DNA binding protein
MKKPTKANDLITTTAAAKILGKPDRTVRQWVTDGTLASITIGKTDLAPGRNLVSRRAVVRLKKKLETEAK